MTASCMLADLNCDPRVSVDMLRRTTSQDGTFRDIKFRSGCGVEQERSGRMRGTVLRNLVGENADVDDGEDLEEPCAHCVSSSQVAE